uniref:AP180 N-terminal homology (ANTH) domain-containing protein n=1 Tax=Nelumbo nucifera TaxID=4432 RepID=A0A822ZFK1_NELNU|nr:TPA_asm: hypothetical protein HUJ06_001573 [Nelumbo nucifera]
MTTFFFDLKKLEYRSSSWRWWVGMAPSIRKAIGAAVKDQTNIGLVKVASNTAPDLEVAIVRATRLDCGYGNSSSEYADFRDEAHSNSWDHSTFVWTYALYLDQRLECMMHERKRRGGGSGHDRDDRFGDRGERWRPPPRSYEYKYGEFKDEPGYGNYGGPPRQSRSYGDLNESQGREERKPDALATAASRSRSVLGLSTHRHSQEPKPQQQHDLRDDGASAEDQSNRLTLALFSGRPNGNANNSWEAFPSEGGASRQPEVTSAADSCCQGWKGRLEVGSVLLNGMYDQGAVRQQMSTLSLSLSPQKNLRCSFTARSEKMNSIFL